MRLNKTVDDLEYREIEYLGKKLSSISFVRTSPELKEYIRNGLRSIPNDIKIKKEFENIGNGQTNSSNITKKYIRDLMYDTKSYCSRWSLNESIESDDLIDYMCGKIIKNDKMYSKNEDLFGKNLIDNIETFFRLGFKESSKPSNYPIKSIKEILGLYCFNGNYYDYSCGWGARLLGSLSLDINYYGTDPNHLLTEKLIEMSNDYLFYNNYNEFDNMMSGRVTPEVDIRTQGSEKFIPEWENKMSVAFTSPPYFGLEDYVTGEGQSFKEGVTYDDWLSGYFEGTIKNIDRYLVDGGYLGINIENYGKFDLVGDTRKIIEGVGYVKIASHTLENIKRCVSNKENKFLNNNEEISIFQRKKDLV